MIFSYGDIVPPRRDCREICTINSTEFFPLFAEIVGKVVSMSISLGVLGRVGTNGERATPPGHSPP